MLDALELIWLIALTYLVVRQRAMPLDYAADVIADAVEPVMAAPEREPCVPGHEQCHVVESVTQTPHPAHRRWGRR